MFLFLGSSLLDLLTRIGRVLYSLATPTAFVFAAVGAAFVTTPAVEFPTEDPGRLESCPTRSTDSALYSIAARRGETPGEPWRFVSLRRTILRRYPGDGLAAWTFSPAPGLTILRQDSGSSLTTGADVSLLWLLGWVVAPTLLWALYARKTGRFEGREGPAETTAPRRAARPWIWGLTALTALCLVAGPPDATGDRPLTAEVRGDPYTSWHAKALWVAGERDVMEEESGGVNVRQTLFGSRRWGLTVERDRFSTRSRGPRPPDAATARQRVAVAVSLWWLTAAAALWSAVSVWRAKRFPPLPDVTA